MAGCQIIVTEAAAQPASSTDDSDLTDEQNSILDPQNRTDDANAERFVQEHKHHLRFVPAKEKDGGRWLYSRKGLWRGDDGFTRAKQAAKRTGRKFFGAIKPYLNKKDLATQKQLIKWAMDGQSNAGQRAMLESAKSHPDMVIFEEQLDTNNDILPVENGVIELVTDPEKGTVCGHFREHNSGDYVTKVAPIVFDREATCPRFRTFLSEMLCDYNGEHFQLCDCDGEREDCQCPPAPTKEQIEANEHLVTERLWKAVYGKAAHRDMLEYISTLLGYLITGEVNEHAAYLLHGPGDNGKSTLVGALESVLGGHFSGTSSDNFLIMSKKTSSNDLEKLKLRGKRMVTAMEVNAGSKLNEALLKQITGGDILRGRGHYQDFEDFPATHKIIICCNDLPEITGTDNGIWRRLKLIPCTVAVPKEKKDKDLPKKLHAERAGILNYAIAGLQRFRKDGMREPKRVTDAIQGYREDSDTLQKFVNERCVLHSAAITKAGHFYDAYVHWYKQMIAPNRPRGPSAVHE
jgi:putative DNA primase/helicase